MKRAVFTLIAICLIMFIGSQISRGTEEANQKTIANKIIRFHVIANSDDEKDQNLKLKVRDKILEYIQPKLMKAQNIDDSRKILLQNNEAIQRIAKEVIASNGYNYSVSAALSNENFPVKTYGNITLPQGNYEAYRVIIGTGKGHNWWCVMFPPLCFVDITKSDVAYEETEKRMKSVLNDDEYNLIDNQKQNNSFVKFEEKDSSVKLKDEKKTPSIKFKFKIVEVVEGLFK